MFVQSCIQRNRHHTAPATVLRSKSASGIVGSAYLASASTNPPPLVTCRAHKGHQAPAPLINSNSLPPRFAQQTSEQSFPLHRSSCHLREQLGGEKNFSQEKQAVDRTRGKSQLETCGLEETALSSSGHEQVPTVEPSPAAPPAAPTKLVDAERAQMFIGSQEASSSVWSELESSAGEQRLFLTTCKRHPSSKSLKRNSSEFHDDLYEVKLEPAQRGNRDNSRHLEQQVAELERPPRRISRARRPLDDAGRRHQWTQASIRLEQHQQHQGLGRASESEHLAGCRRVVPLSAPMIFYKQDAAASNLSPHSGNGSKGASEQQQQHKSRSPPSCSLHANHRSRCHHHRVCVNVSGEFKQDLVKSGDVDERKTSSLLSILNRSYALSSLLAFGRSLAGKLFVKHQEGLTKNKSVAPIAAAGPQQGSIFWSPRKNLQIISAFCFSFLTYQLETWRLLADSASSFDLAASSSCSSSLEPKSETRNKNPPGQPPSSEPGHLALNDPTLRAQVNLNCETGEGSSGSGKQAKMPEAGWHLPSGVARPPQVATSATMPALHESEMNTFTTPGRWPVQIVHVAPHQEGHQGSQMVEWQWEQIGHPINGCRQVNYDHEQVGANYNVVSPTNDQMNHLNSFYATPLHGHEQRRRRQQQRQDESGFLRQRSLTDEAGRLDHAMDRLDLCVDDNHHQMAPHDCAPVTVPTVMDNGLILNADSHDRNRATNSWSYLGDHHEESPVPIVSLSEPGALGGEVRGPVGMKGERRGPPVSRRTTRGLQSAVSVLADDQVTRSQQHRSHLNRIVQRQHSSHECCGAAFSFTDYESQRPVPESTYNQHRLHVGHQKQQQQPRKPKQLVSGSDSELLLHQQCAMSARCPLMSGLPEAKVTTVTGRAREESAGQPDGGYELQHSWNTNEEKSCNLCHLGTAGSTIKSLKSRTQVSKVNRADGSVGGSGGSGSVSPVAGGSSQMLAGQSQNANKLHPKTGSERNKQRSASPGKLSLAGARRRLWLRQKGLSSLSVHRSEEVAPLEAQHLVRQKTANSLNDSGTESDSIWLERALSAASGAGHAQPLGSYDIKAAFVAGLGQGQVASRQALVSPYLGDIQLALSDQRGMLEVEIVRARCLQQKAGAKVVPSPFVKVYLMKNKKCIAKFKTAACKETLNPLYQQKFTFRQDYTNCVLQVIVWTDYGRKGRKSLMGIVQIQLDELDISDLVLGWYQLLNAPSTADSFVSSKALRQSILERSMTTTSQLQSKSSCL